MLEPEWERLTLLQILSGNNKLDTTLNIANIIALVSIIFGGIWAFFQLRQKADDAYNQTKSLKTEISTVDHETTKKIRYLEKEISELRLEMTKEYASVTHLKEVELRLATTIDSLVVEIRGLREFLMQKTNLTNK